LSFHWLLNVYNRTSNYFQNCSGVRIDAIALINKVKNKRFK